MYGVQNVRAVQRPLTNGASILLMLIAITRSVGTPTPLCPILVHVKLTQLESAELLAHVRLDEPVIRQQVHVLHWPFTHFLGRAHSRHLVQRQSDRHVARRGGNLARSGGSSSDRRGDNRS